MTFRNTLLAAAMLGLPAAASAQPLSGYYVGAGAGINVMQFEGIQATVPRVGTGGGWLKPNIGPSVEISAGYAFGNGFRAELEGLFTYDSFHGSAGNGVNLGGSEQKYGPMFNVLYDFVGVLPVVTPYAGLGAGYLWSNEQNVHVGPFNVGAQSKGAFAYQGILGLSLPIATAPGLSLTADYRFVGLEGNRSYSGSAGAFPGSARLSNDYTHTVMVGFTYAFGAPAPAPVPVAAAVPPSPVSRSYIVFFDWDKSNLTPRATQIVAEAAAASTKVQVTRIEVNGYTDTSGTPAYNQGLSIRRAKTVQAELVKDGVPASAIAIMGYGETNLLVPTGPGVREPQNRRVEIILK